MTKKITETIIQSEKTEDQEKDQKFLESIDNFFEGIATDCTCEVYRDQPKALESFLESIPITQGERPIDLEYLAKTWGGRVLRLMVRNSEGRFIKRLYIPLKSYSPRMWGEEISDNPNINMKKSNPETSIEKPADPLEQYLRISEVMKAQNEINKSNQPDVAAILLSILTPLLQQRLEPPKTQTGESLSEMMKSLKMMRDFLVKDDPSPVPPGSSTEDMIIPAILNLSEKILSKPSPQPQPQPKQLQPMPQPQPPKIEQPVPINRKAQEMPLNPVNISNFMKQLDGDQASLMVLEAMKDMKPEQGEKMIQNLMQAFGFEAVEDEDSPETVPKPDADHERNAG